MERTTVTDEGIRFSNSIEQLRSFCRGEMSAVETYRQAIGASCEPWVLQRLQGNMASHQARVEVLRRRIEELGGDPPESSGPWGTFARAVEGTAAALGQTPALAVLEEGEDHGLKDYRDDISNLDDESQRLVRDVLLPQQVQTHRTLSDLKHHMP